MAVSSKNTSGSNTNWSDGQSGGGSSTPPPTASPWQRPSNWLALPSIATTEQKFVGNFAVFPSTAYGWPNECMLMASGAYTVNWGDGVTQNFASGAIATHIYSYASLPTATTVFRQVIVTVTPQVGSNLTSLNLSKDTLTNFTSQWLECLVGSPSLTNLVVGGGGSVNQHPLLLCFGIAKANLSNVTNTFRECNALEAIYGDDVGAITVMSATFYQCTRLIKLPDWNTSSCTLMNFTLYGCRSLQSFPDWNTTSVQNASYLFYVVESMVSTPAFSFPALTNAQEMCSQCYKLKNFNILNLGAVTNTTLLFDGSVLEGVTSAPPVSFSIANLRFSRPALVALFNLLATVTGQTLNITGNPGVATLTAADRLIATNKGWTLTG